MLVAFFVIAGGRMYAQSVGDYRSKASGNWNALGTWELWSGIAWIPATVVTPTSTNGVITILNGHNVTVSAAVTVDQVVVNTGGTITIDAALTIANGSGTDLDVTGTVVQDGTGSFVENSGMTIAFQSGGKYQHNFTTSNGTLPTATWNAASTCEIIGYTSATGPISNSAQTFGNFTWNSASQTSTFALGGNITSVAGNFTVTTTNSGSLQLATTGTTTSITGNYSQGAGTVEIASGSGDQTMNVTGNFSVSGGTLRLSSSSGNATANVTGNFSHTAGTITKTSTGSGTIVFNKSGSQTYTPGGTLASGINLTVNSSSTVQVNGNLTNPGVMTNGGTVTVGP